ncbi:MAG: hypothetical protein LBK55_05155 [Azoarcus sp.]|nr:hypothetical protein [Azoarcus sp.]
MTEGAESCGLAHGGFDGIAGVVLDATFYSYKTIANDKFPCCSCTATGTISFHSNTLSRLVKR